MSDARQCTEECTMDTPPTSPVHTPLCTPPTTPPPSPRRLTADKRVPVPWAQQEAALLDTVERAAPPPPAPPAPPPAPKQQRVFTMGTVYTLTDQYDTTSHWLCMKRTKCFVWLKEVHEHHYLKDIYKRKIITNEHGEHCSAATHYGQLSAQDVTAAEDVPKTPPQPSDIRTQTAYEVLGITNPEQWRMQLNTTDLKKMYRKAALKAHPDKGGTEQQFTALTAAHKHLLSVAVWNSCSVGVSY